MQQPGRQTWNDLKWGAGHHWPPRWRRLDRRAVGIAETVNVIPANPRSTVFSRQKHSANAEADMAEVYFRRNLFYH